MKHILHGCLVDTRKASTPSNCVTGCGGTLRKKGRTSESPARSEPHDVESRVIPPTFGNGATNVPPRRLKFKEKKRESCLVRNQTRMSLPVNTQLPFDAHFIWCVQQKKKKKEKQTRYKQFSAPRPLSRFIGRLHKRRLASLRLISRHAEMNPPAPPPPLPPPLTHSLSSLISTRFLFHGEKMTRSTRRINSDSRRGFEDSETAPVVVTRNVRYRALSRLSAAEHSRPFRGGPLEMTAPDWFWR